MTLSLDDVRNKRFRMARRNGYEVAEVDEFVDEVESSFEQLVDENANLKQQIEALSSGAAPQAPAPVAEVSTPTATGPESRSEPQTIVVTTAKEASTAVVRLVEMSTEQAERLVSEANAEAERIREDATRNAQQVADDSQRRADEAEASAKTRTDELDQELAAKRSDMFGHLEREQTELSDAVHRLREFESSYRSNLADELRDHLARLDTLHAEPADAPPLQAAPDPSDTDNGTDDGASSPTDATESQTGSETPHLDALLGDHR